MVSQFTEYLPHRKTRTGEETAIISSSIVAGGLVLIPLKDQKIIVGEKWRVKSLFFEKREDNRQISRLFRE